MNANAKMTQKCPAVSINSMICSAPWPIISGVLLASSALLHTAHQDSEADRELAPMKQDGWHLLDPATRRRTFYKYERRIRDFSQPDKVFHYFASRSLEDGTRQGLITEYIQNFFPPTPPPHTPPPFVLFSLCEACLVPSAANGTLYWLSGKSMC